MTDDIGKKVEYVLAQGQIKIHTCHWPDCKEQVPPSMWGCRKHWYTLPRHLRTKIWVEYNPGQEISGNPSRGYIEVAEEVQDWIRGFMELQRLRGQK